VVTAPVVMGEVQVQREHRVAWMIQDTLDRMAVLHHVTAGTVLRTRKQCHKLVQAVCVV
jgi:hypothetical protein